MNPVFEQCKYGLFVHFVAEVTVRSDGSLPDTIDELVNDFDVEGFAGQVAAMHVQYLILTAWHYKMRPLYPSAVTEKWRPGNSPKRDLLGEIIDAVRARGIHMILYTHPRDGHDFDEADRLATGWGPGHEGSWLDTPDFANFDYVKWNTYIRELYTELAQRYGKKLLGFYTDGVGPHKGKDAKMENNFQIVDYLMIRDIMKSANPDMVMIQNYFGYLFSDDYAMPECFFGYEDQLHWKTARFPAAQKAMALCPFRGGWLPEPIPRGKDVRLAEVKAILQYTLFYASCSNSGGLAWASGPYCEGNLWPVGVLETMTEVGEALEHYWESILTAVPSTSFPTISGDTLEGKDFQFFTASADGTYEYLHLMKAPEQNTVMLPAPEDGAQLLEPVSLTDGLEVIAFRETEDGGWQLKLAGTYDAVDSVIRFTRRMSSAAPQIVWLNDTDKRFRYEGDWKYCHLTAEAGAEKALGCFEHDFHRAAKQGDSFFLAFEGDVLEIYGNERLDNGKALVFIDGVEVRRIGEQVDNLDCQKVRQLLFRSGRLHGGWHTLYVVLTEGQTFEFDAVKIIK